MQRSRRERDSIGEMEIPADADYGIQTARAVENFPITGIKLSHFPELVESLAMVKKAAAIANRELGKLKPEIAAAIILRPDHRRRQARRFRGRHAAGRGGNLHQHECQ
jgi:aspartate ammonia-lyase